MIGAYTGRGIAVMQDAQTGGDRTVVQFPRHAVRVVYPAAFAATANVAVAVARLRPCPQPAQPQFGPMRWHRTIFVDLRPEPLSQWAPLTRGATYARTRIAAKLAATQRDLAGIALERRAALLTDAWNLLNQGPSHQIPPGVLVLTLYYSRYREVRHAS